MLLSKPWSLLRNRRKKEPPFMFGLSPPPLSFFSDGHSWIFVWGESGGGAGEASKTKDATVPLVCSVSTLLGPSDDETVREATEMLYRAIPASFVASEGAIHTPRGMVFAYNDTRRDVQEVIDWFDRALALS